MRREGGAQMLRWALALFVIVATESGVVRAPTPHVPTTQVGGLNQGAGPVPVTGVGSWSAITTGVVHACGLKKNGNIRCWGSGVCSDYSKICNQNVIPVSLGGNMTTQKFAAVSAGGFFTCALALSGSITCWGQDHVGETKAPSGKYMALSSGLDSSCAIALHGKRIVCWGRNDFGQATPPNNKLPSGETWKTVSMGAKHACAVTSGAKLFCWGDNSYGQSYGYSNTATHTADLWKYGYPVDKGTTGAIELSWASVAAGWFYSCGELTDGTAVCWGADQQAQKGCTELPGGKVLYADFVYRSSDFYQPSVSMFYQATTCAIRKANSTVACFGNNDYHQVSGVPKGVAFSSLSVSLGGGGYICGLLTNGGAVCWGDGVYDTGIENIPAQ